MIIRKETLTAALAATTADDTRYYMNAVQIDPEKHRVISTNGHVLIVATEESPMQDEDFPDVAGAPFHGQPAKMAVNADVVRSMIAAMPKKTPLPILQTVQFSQNGSPETATMAVTDLQAPRVATVKEDGTFPQWERIIDAFWDRESVTVCLAVDVLETLIKAAKSAAPSAGKHGKPAVITFRVPTGEKDRDDKGTGACISAVEFRVNGPDVKLHGAAMPCRA